MTRHTDAETLSRYRDGDLGPWRSWRVRTHLAQCAECRETIADIAAVTTLLASVRQPPMPEGVFVQIRGALARETLAERTVRGAPEAVPAATVPSERPAARTGGRIWRQRWQRAWQQVQPEPGRLIRLPQPAGARSPAAVGVAAAAAAVAIVVGGGYEIAVHLGGSTPAGVAAGAQVPGVEPSIGYGPGLPYAHAGRVDQVTPLTTSTNFTPARLAGQVTQITGLEQSSIGAPSFVAPLVTPSPAISRAGIRPAVGSAPSAGPDAGAATFAGIPLRILDGCVNRIAAGQAVLLVDVAHYQGAKATVIVTQASASSQPQVWVVGSACSGSRSDILAHAALPAGR